MATLTYDATTPFGAKAASLSGQIAELSAKVVRIRDAASALAYSTGVNGGDWTLLESDVDFKVGSSDGQEWFNALNAMATALTSNEFVAGRNAIDKGF